MGFNCRAASCSQGERLDFGGLREILLVSIIETQLLGEKARVETEAVSKGVPEHLDTKYRLKGPCACLPSWQSRRGEHGPQLLHQRALGPRSWSRSIWLQGCYSNPELQERRLGI